MTQRTYTIDEYRHMNELSYEGAGFMHVGRGFHIAWWTWEGCLDAPEAIPAGSMLVNEAADIGFRKGYPRMAARAEDWVWVTDPIVGDRVRITGDALESWKKEFQ